MRINLADYESEDDFFKAIVQSSKDEKPLGGDEELHKSVRNVALTMVLGQAYLENKKTKLDNRLLKKIFFGSVMGILYCLIAVVIVITIVFAIRGVAVEELAVIIAPFATLMTAIIILPRIIAQYLFPKEEFTQYVDIIKAMIDKDNDKDSKNKTK